MQIKMTLSATAAADDITMAVLLDDQEIFHCSAKNQSWQVCHDINDSAGQHRLRLVMQGKQPHHTEFDQQNQIIKDVCFQLEQICFNEIEVNEVYCLGQEIYQHNYNSDGPTFVDEFHGTMGCNGTVDIDFFTPIYLWMYHYID